MTPLSLCLVAAARRSPTRKGEGRAPVTPAAVYLLAAALCALATLVPPDALEARAAEIHSNGRGGGPWSEPDTWHGGTVPTTGDTAVIAMRDTVIFDRDDTDQPTCAALYLDPEAVLTFRPGDRRYTLNVAGPVESYGTIRIDGTADRRGERELRLSAADAGQRTIRLLENAALLVYGHEQHRPDDRTVRITASPVAGGPRTAGSITANRRVMVDLHRTLLQDVQVSLTGIDNTGAKGNERLNIIGCRFTGLSWLTLIECDTPAIRHNAFTTQDPRTLAKHAIHVDSTSLAEIRGNSIRGTYEDGILLYRDTDSAIIENEISGANRGIYAMGRNMTIRDTVVAGARFGVMIDRGQAVLERVVVRASATAFRPLRATVQFTDCSVVERPENGNAIVMDHSGIQLVNSPIELDEIVRNSRPMTPMPHIETMQYVIVRVRTDDPKGLPPGTRVTVRTNEASGGVPKEGADLNVRNSPAPLAPNGFTPLPGTQRAIAVRSWSVDFSNAVRQAPFYDLIVEAPDPKSDGYRTLKTQLIEPSAAWFRPQPNRLEPTIEVTVP